MIDWASYGVESKSQVTAQMIANVEAKLGVSLPSAYLDLVRYNDEAIFEIGTFEYDGGMTCISEFFKFTDDQEQYSILWYKQPDRFDLPAELVAIARDAGDYLICLDFGAPDVPVKLYVPDEKALLNIADNFEKFISSLQE
jgi:hypothetical protein